MAQLYLKKELYDSIIKRGFDVTEFVNQAVEMSLKTKEGKK